MNVLQFIRTKRGSFTIEAALIFPLLFLVIIATLYICLILYHQVYIQSFADKLAMRAANNWSNSAKRMYDGALTSEGFRDKAIYWHIIDTKQNEKIEKIKEYGKDQYGKHALLFGAGDIRIDVERKRELLIYNRIIIRAEAEMDNPIGDLLKMFGMGKVLTFSVESDAMVNDPAEFVRNLDFAYDCVTRIEHKYGVDMSFLEKAKEQVANAFSTINKFFSG